MIKNKNTMKNGKKFFDNFDSLKGVSFIRINNYIAKTSGEIANHIINVGLSVEKAKETDLMRLKTCNDKDLENISVASQIAIDVCRVALSEMLASAEKNLSEKKEERTAQSQGQADAYIYITSAIRLHKDTQELHIFGQAVNKVVIVKGEYKTVKSSDKTLAKNAIKKHLDLRSDKFKDFIVANVETVKMNGETIEIN
jgi:hypothetical protein